MMGRLCSKTVLGFVGGWLLVSGCSPVDDVGTTETSVIYDNDDRKDYFEHGDLQLLRWTEEATVALIPKTQVDASDPANIQINAPEYGTEQDLCASERFFEQPAAARCSGTLIDRDLVLTAGHCIDSLDECRSFQFVFGFYYETSRRLRTLRPEDLFECRRIVAKGAIDSPYDYAIIQLDRPAPVEKNPAPVRTDLTGLALESPVAIIGFPGGIPAKIDDGGAVQTDGRPNFDYFTATLDAFGGSSGAGVYQDGELAGILVRGQPDYRPQNDCLAANVLGPAYRGESEDVLYISRALEGLCASSWRTELCEAPEGWCRPCSDDTHCPDEWRCQTGADPSVSWCAPACSTETPCAADHTCIDGTCQPQTSEGCFDNAVWNINACGRTVNTVQPCVDGLEVCRNGACETAPAGTSCQRPFDLPASAQTLTGSFQEDLRSLAIGSCGGRGPEHVYRLQVDQVSDFSASVDGFDPVLYLRNACGDEAEEVACNDDLNAGTRSSFIETRLEPGEYFLFVDAFSIASTYTLTTELTPKGCGCRATSSEPTPFFILWGMVGLAGYLRTRQR